MSAPIVILTDFGLEDPYVGILKGVIARISPTATTIDLTNEIPPGEVLRAAVTLWQSAPYFPNGTIFLCVVDPGVGTARPALLVKPDNFEGKDFTLIGPDNGLFSFVMGDNPKAWEIRNPEFMLPEISNTFQGRDIFAPAAAHAWKGRSGDVFGPAVGDLVRLSPPHLANEGFGRLEGEVLFSDRFGNVLTSLGRFEWQGTELLQFSPWLPGIKPARIFQKNVKLELPDGNRLKLVKTFKETNPDECAGLAGSSGLLEIVAYQQSAREILKLEPGDIIKLVESAQDNLEHKKL